METLNETNYPYYDQYESFFNSTFECHYCSQTIKRGESIGRCGFKCASCRSIIPEPGKNVPVCTHSDNGNKSKSSCSYHTGEITPHNKKRESFYMNCCGGSPLSKGCKPCDHNDKPHRERYLDIPAFCIVKGWVKALKSNNAEQREVFLEQNKEKKLNIFETIYKIKRFEI